MDLKAIADNLKYHRQSKGYSQEELSKRTNVTVRTIQRIEKAEVNPHLNTIKQLSIALDIEVNDLIPQANPKDETVRKKWLLLLHATPLLGMILPLCNVLFPLFLWIHKREDNPIYDRHGVKVINFQITALILYVGSIVSLITIEKWGFFLFITIGPLILLITLFNIIYVLREEKCYYPLSLPFLRSKANSKAPSLVVVILMMVLFQNCENKQSESVTRLDGSTISFDSLTTAINEIIVEAGVPGTAIAIFNKNQPVLHKTFGYKDFPEKIPLTDSTNIYGASFSKALFAVLAMKMVEDDVIDLDTPLESYLPKKIYEYEPITRWHDNFSDLRADSLYQKITARMCLSHTTGFPNYRWFEEDKKLRVKSTPGARYGYSGEGFIYLQVVLEKLTGKGLEELAIENIFKPLGMENSSYQWLPKFEKDFALGHGGEQQALKKDKDNEPRGGGTLETTSDDYVMFLTAVLNNKIITEESYNEIFSPQIRIHSEGQFGPPAFTSTDRYDSINLSYGLGWGYFETPHGPAVFKEGNGSGFQHYSILFPEAGIGLMIMTNSVKGNSTFQKICDLTIRNTYTPWEWQGYVSYDE